MAETEPTTTPAEARKEEKWAAGADERRALKKAKKVAAKEARRRGDAPQKPKPRSLKLDPQRPSSNVRVVIDCDFERGDDGKQMMNDKEVMSMARQLGRSYAENRRAVVPVQLSVCGVGSALSAVMNRTQKDWKQWKLAIDEKPLLEAIPDKDNIVYLTADSTTVLEDLDETKAYIIGGIVDRNRYKNLCLNRAEAAGLKTAQLPIGEYIKMASRRDWKEAFLHVIPQRKIAPKPTKKGKSKEEQGKDGDDEDKNGDDEDNEDENDDGEEDEETNVEEEEEEQDK
ncbi:hypothetical protein BCR33DRAFT_765416 [Rhizoclosmatium globosum]|uniref:tRNA (guanine(9)-N1)-methyltransferase n=1 Tax=Rhizoclosmatium globosum TaxID=329046 RepID=A0A1Y2CEX3_9FUNG|nr:hypothetical protein BCR33DRAFT_765416 [Rhizoclosmatium globosum]|eukprot:ORY45603.1 hypothetical protein BCR33DRAFT_765416 [Rhizoclosmatium globosum]